ncbi:hypothetical protein BRADI_1g41651v3, partial [Brachypodium distachyon]
TKKEKRERERDAKRTDEEKQEKLKKRRESYKQKTDEEKQEQLEKRREAYEQKKEKVTEQKTKQQAQHRRRYANMQPEQKKARINQIGANRELKRSTPSRDSIAMENPAYITAEQEVNISPLKVRRRKTVTPGERQTLVHRRNKEFSTRQRKTVQVSVQEDTSKMKTHNDEIEATNKNVDEQPQPFFNENERHPKHLELYFYDDDPSLEHRYRRCRKETYEQDKHVVGIITEILRENPYSKQFRSLGQAEDLDDYRLILNLDQRLDQRTYNAPITSEVAAVWIKGNQRRNTFDKNVIIHGNNNEIQIIKSYYGCYDPLSYPLFFPRGELGLHSKIPKANAEEEDMKKAGAEENDDDDDPDATSRLWVTMKEYYCYKLHMRPNIFNPILYGGRLLQQLDYMFHHQKEIRADLYQGLLDSIKAREQDGNAIGKRTVLASSFIGGPRDKLRRYLDAMALVRKYGKPDIFLTMTCNPNWEEIKCELECG